MNPAGWLAPRTLNLFFCEFTYSQLVLDDLLYLDQLVKILCCLICEKKSFCELIIVQLVRFSMMEPVHSGSSPRLGRFKSSTWYGCSYFSGFIPGVNGAILSVVGDVPVDNEVPVVTS